MPHKLGDALVLCCALLLGGGHLESAVAFSLPVGRDQPPLPGFSTDSPDIPLLSVVGAQQLSVLRDCRQELRVRADADDRPFLRQGDQRGA